MNNRKLKVYLTTPVWKEIAFHPKISAKRKETILKLWNELENLTELKVSEERFPSQEEIQKNIQDWGAEIIGCHLSHRITKDMIENSNVASISTSTAGYNHIDLVSNILVTHTPGVLHRTVADFTIAIILANLRNITRLNNFVWSGQWKPGQKWDLDENLSMTMDNLTLGIAGMGEIGKEITRRLAPWGIKILYYDIVQQEEIEKKYSNVRFISNLEDIFKEADIISLHIPLMPATHHIVGEKLLKSMKKGSLLVNTARGPIIDSNLLMSLLEKKEISINLAFDVFEDEPIKSDDMKRWQKIADDNPDLRFVFIPHNASADADTRAQMAIMILEDLIAIASSKSPEDLQNIRLIPELKYLNGNTDKVPDYDSYRISKFW